MSMTYKEVNLSPEEAEGLLERLQTDQASVKDRDRLAQVIRTTTQVSDELLQVRAWRDEAVSARPSAAHHVKRKRQLAKAARHRNRR